MTTNQQLSEVLLLIPCCGSKEGTGPRPQIASAPLKDELSATSMALLNEGRQKAFSAKPGAIDLSSPLLPAMTWYTGRPYKVPDFRTSLDSALTVGLRCLIVSAGYGLLRPDDQIHKYDLTMQETLGIWRRRLPQVLADYAFRNGIKRVFGVLSTKYHEAVAPLGRLLPDVPVRWLVPTVGPMDSGAALQVIPERVAREVIDLIRSGFDPGPAWGSEARVPLAPTTGQSTQATIGMRRESTAADASIVGTDLILEDDMPVFKLKLEKTYFANGFFNVTVDYDRFVRPTEGPVDLILRKTGARIQGKINRSANQNGTARIWGGARLRDYFKDNFRLGEVVDVGLGSFHAIRIG